MVRRKKKSLKRKSVKPVRFYKKIRKIPGLPGDFSNSGY